MKVYKCDSCGRTIDSPHEERMKDFILVLLAKDFLLFLITISVELKFICVMIVFVDYTR